MAVESGITVNEVLILEVDASPIIDPVDAPIGSLAMLGDGVSGLIWIKTGAANSAWTKIHQGNVANNQVAFGDSNGNIVGSGDLTWNGSSLSITGSIITSDFIRPGNTADITDGNIRYTGSDIEARIGGQWVSLSEFIADHSGLNLDDGTNPHGTTKADVGLSQVPNVDATNRANHTGTQLASTISDFNSAVQAAETTTSISLNANILTYTDEDGTDTDIDLSIYLDDTNLARIVSGTIDPVTNIATFTRDDSSTFTVDFSSLNDQTAINTAISNHEQSIDNHDDVDTTTSTPDVDDVLSWDGSNWVPTFNPVSALAGGQVNADATTNSALNASVSSLGTGLYRITFGTALLDANYPIILSLLENAGTDDYKIAYENVTPTSFDVRITEQDDGGSNGTLTNSGFSFYIPNLSGQIGPQNDHGGLAGLTDDDHPQYLNETRHDALPQDNPHNVTATQVGLGNVDNTSDLNKPISTATQAALNDKVTGPGSSTDNALARFDGTTGKLVQNSDAVLDDSGNLTIASNIQGSSITSTSWIRPGNTADTTNGNIRYTGTDFEGRVGGEWLSLTEQSFENFQQNASSSNEVTTTSSTFQLVGDTVLTPPAGDYIVIFTGSTETFGTNGEGEIALFKNTTVLPDSVKEVSINVTAFLGASGTAASPSCLLAVVNVNGSDTIQAGIRSVDGQTFGVGERTIIALRYS